MQKTCLYIGKGIYLTGCLLMKKNQFGITVHYINSGIDTGDTILQKQYLIAEYDTYETSLYVMG